MGSKKFEYTGHDNLEAMTGAVKYNKFLKQLVTKQSGVADLKQKKILDFGAGSGTYADMLKADGYTVDCVEPDGKLQKILKEKGYQVKSYAEDLAPNSYDVIYAFNVMEHVEKDYEVFDQLTKALRKNGVIIIYVPAFQSIYSSMDELVGHFRRYRKGHLWFMANRSGLDVKKLHYVDAPGYLASLVFKLGGNKQGNISQGSVKLYDSVVFPVSRVLEPATRHLFGKNVVLIAQKA